MPQISSVATEVKKLGIVRFAPKQTQGFYDTLKEKVDSYLAENNLDVNGNSKMIGKTIIMVALYVLPYIAMIAGLGSSSLFIFYGLWALMGIGMVGIGCAVMHDSNHGTYSSNKKVNKYMGKIIALVGGYEPTWRIQHNILHHTYTNIEGLDHDLDAGVFLRFSPHAKKYSMHRFQHVYAWFLYGLLTLQWATIKDFRQVIAYAKMDLLKKEKLTLRKALLQVTAYKLVYYTFLFVIPIFVMGIAWQQILIGFVIMHFIAGLSLSAIFQLAHVMEDCEFPEAPEDRKMENTWAIHQLLNTADFSPRSPFMNWFVGGLNHQIEHHLFPHISHVHYRQIAPIVRSTAQEFGLPYLVQPTFVHALWYHARMLKKLGNS